MELFGVKPLCSVSVLTFPTQNGSICMSFVRLGHRDGSDCLPTVWEMWH